MGELGAKDTKEHSNIAPSQIEAAQVNNAVLAPEHVIDNPKCRMSAGSGNAKGTALVVVPASDGARFAVLDADGTVFAGSLNFMPHHLRLGRRSDGTLVAGLADLRLNSREFREPEAPEPLHIYVNAQLVYETTKAWNFGVARDGSSFFVLEPMAGDASRLLLRNLDLGEETHFDLGSVFKPANPYDPGFVARYTDRQDEVMFHQGGDFGRGLYHFYSVDGGHTRTIGIGLPTNTAAAATVGLEMPDDAFEARIISSEIGYFAYSLKREAPDTTGMPERWLIMKRRFRYGPEPAVEEIWSRDLHLSGFNGSMVESDDGRWLALGAWDFTLLNSTTADTVFVYPQVDKAAERARLESVIPADAANEDVGGVQGHYFRGGELVFLRQVGSTRACGGRGGLEGYRSCVADLRSRGLYRTVLDVFDLDRITLQGQPDFRFEINPDNQCARGHHPLRGLQDHGGRLTYLGSSGHT